jgi:hypothetical protein
VRAGSRPRPGAASLGYVVGRVSFDPVSTHAPPLLTVWFGLLSGTGTALAENIIRAGESCAVCRGRERGFHSGVNAGVPSAQI